MQVDAGSLVHGCPDWGEPGRQDRHDLDQDSHVTTDIQQVVVVVVVGLGLPLRGQFTDWADRCLAATRPLTISAGREI